MDRMNQMGKALLDYKREYSNHYSPIVDESLMLSLENKLEKKMLNQETFDLIINDSVTYEELRKFILNKKEYLKTYKELFEEFEKVRELVNKTLHKLNFVDFIETESNVENNQITILKQYTLNEEYIKVFFGLEDKDMPQIMKKKGFAEKFAVLRLTKILKEILSEMRTDSEYSQGCSKVYYNSDCNGFSIDYKYRINVDSIKDENVEDKIKKIRDTDKVVERKFLTKTSIKFYSLKPLEPKISNSIKIGPDKDSIINQNVPNNKLKDTEITKEELDKVHNELIANQEQDNKTSENNIIEENKEIKKTDNVKSKEHKYSEVNISINTNKKPIEEKPKNKEALDETTKTENNSESLEIIGEVSNINTEEDFSEEFFKEDFSGFSPEEDIDISDLEIEIPDDINDTDDL